MATCHLAHDVVLADHVIIANNSLLAGHVHVGKKAFISGNVGIHQHVHIGAHAMVGGVLMVVQDVPPHATVAGEHATFFGINAIGLKRAGFSSAERSEVKNIYRLFYGRENVSLALKELEALPPTPILEEILLFIKSSKRGIVAKHKTVNVMPGDLSADKE
jgi:UDP-N-acetylglucosamine acyltransferase